MLSLTSKCHTNYHLHPFNFVLFKFKILVGEQHLTNVCVAVDDVIVISLFCNPGLPPSPPQNLGYHVQHYGPHNVTVTVQWGYPEFDGGVPVNNYTISGTNIMTITSQINETTLTLPYNARQTIEVAATNCIGTSGTAMLTYFEGV